MRFWPKLTRYLNSLPTRLRRTRISVVHEDDLLALAASLGIADDLLQGRLRCRCCNQPVTLDNLWGILITKGGVRPVCADPQCLSDIY